MSDDRNKVTDKAGEIARNIWLAGVGAYGKAVEEAQGRLEKAMEPPKLFRDLVKVGAALEEEARESTLAARHSVEERINRVRENFHNQRPARIEDLLALQKKVDQLSRKVDSLRHALEEQLAGQRRQGASGRRAGKASAAATRQPSTGKKPAARIARATGANTASSRKNRRKAHASKRKVR